MIASTILAPIPQAFHFPTLGHINDYYDLWAKASSPLFHPMINSGLSWFLLTSPFNDDASSDVNWASAISMPGGAPPSFSSFSRCLAHLTIST